MRSLAPLPARAMWYRLVRVWVLPPPNWVMRDSTGAALSVLPDSRRRTVPVCSVRDWVKYVLEKNCSGVLVVGWSLPVHHLVKGDGELVRVEGAALTDFLSGGYHSVPGVHDPLPPVEGSLGRILIRFGVTTIIAPDCISAA